MKYFPYNTEARGEKHKGVKYSDHAIKRWFDYYKPSVLPQAEKGIKRIIELGVPVRPTNEEVRLMNNKYQKTTYFKHGSSVAVIVDGTVLTIIDYNENPQHWEFI